MSTDDIKALRVSGIADANAILWLWTTNAHLRAAFEVVDAWGFEYKTLLTWIKDRMGTGDWLRAQTEHCLLAVRGKPVFVSGQHTTALEAARREHSRKPEEFYRLVENTCPGSKVELFARAERPGWQAFGDQVSSYSRIQSGSSPEADFSGKGNPKAM
jgi:N6-adenosine-specific RNA methylase IME4